MKKKIKLSGYKIDTFDEEAFFTFFTEAENSEKALRSLQLNSTDYKNIVNKDKDFTVRVIKVY